MPPLDPNSAAGQVLEHMLANRDDAFSREICLAVGMSQQRTNQGLKALYDRGLVRWDEVTAPRGSYCRRWELTPAATGEEFEIPPDAPRSTVQKAIAAMPPLQRVWLERRA